MRLAVHGILADQAGSGAGSFPRLLTALLEAGHRVEFFANGGYIRPRSLERFPGYRFRSLRVEALERAWRFASRFHTEYPRAAAAQLAHLGYDRAAKREIAALHASEPYDLILCTDAQSFWPSRLPVVSWPQSPPQTEARSLRSPAILGPVVRERGPAYYAAVQGYYAYRGLLARAALPLTDIFLCATEWARSEWIRFGVEASRVRLLPYIIDLEAFRKASAVGRTSTPTLLWLGRAAPRKRLDLFLAAFAELRQRDPTVRARLVGNLRGDPFASRILETFASVPGVSVEEPLAREAVPALLDEVDVVVQPSENENFGFSLAEALAAGRLVVAGPTNGTLEYAGEAGFGFSDYSPSSVALAMERAVLAARTHGETLSQSARRAAEQFGTEVVMERFLRVGAELVRRKRA